jgi:hypothetical protein
MAPRNFRTIAISVIFLLSLSSTSFGLSTEEILALQDLAQSIPGLQRSSPPWNPSDASRACGPAVWYGLRCSPERSIVEISLLGNDRDQLRILDGFLPARIGAFTELVSFTLKDTSLNGTIPDTVKNWTKLKYLLISDNRFLGPFPDYFSLMPSLVTVQIEDGNSFPSGLSECSNLIHIKLFGRYRIESLPTLSKLTKLTHFLIDAFSFSGDLSVLSQLPVLRRFDLSSTLPYAGSLPFDSLKNLKHLTLRNFQGDFPVALFDLPLLKTLELERCDFKGSSIRGPAKENVQLEELRIKSTRIPDLFKYPYPQNLNNLKALKTLELDSTFVGSLPASLGTWSNLSSISLQFNKLNGSLPDMSGIQNIQVIELYGNDFTGALPSSFNSLPKLRTLTIDSNVSGCFHETVNMATCSLGDSVCVCNAKVCQSHCGASELSSCCATKSPLAAPAAAPSGGVSGGIIAGIIIGLVFVIALPTAIVLYNRSKKDPRDGYMNVPMEERLSE